MKSLKISLVMGFVLLALGSVSQVRGQATQAEPPQFKETVVVTATAKSGAASDYFLTFSRPVGVPGVSLAPGTYLFRFPLRGSNVIQVLKADRSNVYTMFHTIAAADANRDLSSNAHEVTWRERPTGEPPAIKAWFLPGQTTGYAFIYPKASDTATSAQTQPRFEETVVVTATANSGAASDYFLTFSGPVGVPGVSLAPGTYLFKFPAQGSNLIQVLKADRSNVYTMFHTIPAANVNRDLSSDAHDVTWREGRADAPPAIKAWFLPGQTTGYEFIYPGRPGTANR